jgi:hypothetical protein
MKKVFALLAACLLVGACGTLTPQGRIDANPEKFAALTSKQQALVKEGKIDRGMPKDAVLLAWGTPADRFDGYEKNRRTERWNYTGSKPVYSTGLFGGFYDSWGYGGYGRGMSPYYGYAVAPEVLYVPYTRASVSFVNERVDSWDRAK